jgi:hypothetical protein
MFFAGSGFACRRLRSGRRKLESVDAFREHTQHCRAALRLAARVFRFRELRARASNMVTQSSALSKLRSMCSSHHVYNGSVLFALRQTRPDRVGPGLWQRATEMR